MPPFNPEFSPELPEMQNETETIEFPNGESAIEAYLRKYPNEAERAETVKAALYEFLREEIKNIKIFKSEKTGAELPYTSINVAELARNIYKKQTGKMVTENEAVGQGAIAKQQFVFGTGISTAEGDEFTFVEEAISQCVKYLPTALQALKEGKVPEERQIFTVGMPTNILGKIPSELGQKLGEAPFDEMGKVYGELVNAQIQGRKPKTIELYGVSLGSNMAIRAGEALLEQNLATQNFNTAEQNNLPYLQIRAEVPVSLSRSKIKPVQIPVGFVVDALYESRLPEVKRIEAGKAPFAKMVRKELAQRGINEQMSDGQKKAKQKVLFSIISKLGKKFEPKPETKITAVFGLKDLTSYTPGMTNEAKIQKEEFGGTLGQSLLERKSPNIRASTANMPHLSPRFPDNELKRMRRLGIALEKLEKGS